MLNSVLAHASFKMGTSDSDNAITCRKFRSFAISNLADELSAARLQIPTSIKDYFKKVSQRFKRISNNIKIKV